MHSPLDEVARLKSEVAGLKSELGVSERLRIAMYSSLTQKGGHHLCCSSSQHIKQHFTHLAYVWNRSKKRTTGANCSCVYASTGVWCSNTPAVRHECSLPPAVYCTLVGLCCYCIILSLLEQVPSACLSPRATPACFSWHRCIMQAPATESFLQTE